jgi:hypothetical protein
VEGIGGGFWVGRARELGIYIFHRPPVRRAAGPLGGGGAGGWRSDPFGPPFRPETDLPSDETPLKTRTCDQRVSWGVGSGHKTTPRQGSADRKNRLSGSISTCKPIRQRARASSYAKLTIRCPSAVNKTRPFYSRIYPAWRKPTPRNINHRAPVKPNPLHSLDAPLASRTPLDQVSLLTPSPSQAKLPRSSQTPPIPPPSSQTPPTH